MEFFDDEFCRPFTSGSREPPDRQDGFLETTGYYRKHTARDPSSLFRVISEHVFDIQLFHEKVREDCANYLEKNRKDYEKDMDKNFYYYLSNLRKLRTPGGLLELKALAHCYKRNVMLFEPFTAGKWYIEEEDYQHNSPILVFYTADKHFDSIYKKKDIELAAKCQGLIFEILYKEVFQLPDVSYAVERMLHDQLETNTKPLKEDPSKYQTVSGKIVDFDNHETTSCVLENSMMCHFHNRSNFEEFVDSYSVALIPNRKVITSESTGRPRKPLDGFLYDMHKSCVRQLLDEKITPFPYKVAKALDRSIYRNIEFDLWNDNRKELRMKWMEGNPMDRPRLSNRSPRTNVNTRIPSNRHQENSIKSSAMPDKCLIYIDPYGGEKKEVCIGGDLMKMNYDKRYGGTKYGSDRGGGYHYFYPHYNSGYEMVKEDWDDDLKKRVIMVDEDSCSFKMDGFQHFQPYETETVVMPASMHGRGYYKNKRGGGRNAAPHFEEKHEGNQNAPGNQGEDPMYNPQYYEQVQYVQYDQQQNPVASGQPQNQLWNGPAQYLHQQYAQYPPIVPQYYHHPPPHPFYHQYPMQPMPMPPQIAVHPPSNQLFVPQMGITLNDALNLLKEQDLQANINFNVRECTDLKDLPNDEKSLQFYYNLGIKYFQYCVVHQNCGGPGSCGSSNSNERPESRASNSNPPRNHEEGSKGRNNHEGVQSTPVSSNKPTSILQNSGQKHQGNNGGQRKPFLGPRTFHQKRNDVKFNPNVKNVHKSEAFGKSTNSSSGSHTLTTSTANSSVVSAVPTISPLSPIPYEDVGPNNQQSQNLQNAVYQPPFYTPPVLPYYQDSEHMPQYIQSIPGATYITVPMTPQTGPGPIIYQQPLDPNLSADSGIIEAQYTPGNYQQMVYVPGPQGGPHYAAPGSGNYVYYTQPASQTPQVQPPVAAASNTTPNSNFQASPTNQ